jgi:hypothetical protein
MVAVLGPRSERKQSQAEQQEKSASDHG